MPRGNTGVEDGFVRTVAVRDFRLVTIRARDVVGNRTAVIVEVSAFTAFRGIMARGGEPHVVRRRNGRATIDARVVGHSSVVVRVTDVLRQYRSETVRAGSSVVFGT